MTIGDIWNNINLEVSQHQSKLLISSQPPESQSSESHTIINKWKNDKIVHNIIKENNLHVSKKHTVYVTLVENDFKENTVSQKISNLLTLIIYLEAQTNIEDYCRY